MTDTTMTETTVSIQIPVSALSTTTASKPERLPTTVSKPTPYTHDLAYLTTTDPNPLPLTSSLLSSSFSARNDTLKSIARDGAQTLLTTLLTTTTISSTPDGLLMTLPPSISPLPRWKPLPKPKAPTKWESFARKKGIGKFGGSLKGGALQEDRRKNLVYDEDSGEWVKKWGYKGANKKEEGQWLVELDDKALKKEGEGGGKDRGENVRMEGRRERKERIKRQERRQRGNERRVRKGGG